MYIGATAPGLMKKMILCLFLVAGLISVSGVPHPPDELDRVFIYLNGKLAGTWRANEENQVVHLENLKDGDTLVLKARTDLGGLGNSSIDIKDDTGVPVDNIQSAGSTETEATFVYIFRSAKIELSKVMSLQIFLNVDPARNLPPPTIATISFTKK
jgi:hypothetical protein